ncbi:MAG: hypothetical protein AABX07_02765 [Nanoarchaeota archaeon]
MYTGEVVIYYHERPNWMVERDERRSELIKKIVLFSSCFFIGVLGGYFLPQGNESTISRQTSHNLLPEEVRFYDSNKNGVLEKDETYRLFSDYDFQRKPVEKVPVTSFN